MANKTTATRLTEIWAYLNPSPTQKENILGDMRKKNLSEQAIADQLSLGFWMKGGSMEKTRRQAVRASTFLNVVHLNIRADKVQETLRNSTALTQDKLDENISAILALYKDKPRGVASNKVPTSLQTVTRPVHMASMQSGNTQKRQLAERALNQASDMLTKAWGHLVRAKSPGSSARAYYESWFGTYSDTRYNSVKGVLSTIHKVLCSGDVCLHLRTTDTIGKADDTPGAGGAVIPASIVTANGTYQLSSLFAWAIPKGADGKPHVFLCDVFYQTNGKGPHDAIKTGETWSDNIGGS
jgi:hypothetical protein